MVCFQTINSNLGKFWRSLEWKMWLYFMTIRNILRPFGIFHGRLVKSSHFVYFSRFGMFGSRTIWQTWPWHEISKLHLESSMSKFKTELYLTFLLMLRFNKNLGTKSKKRVPHLSRRKLNKSYSRFETERMFQVFCCNY
jgi:hypothetical protein